MKKKTISILLSIIMMFVVGLTFTACDFVIGPNDNRQLLYQASDLHQRVEALNSSQNGDNQGSNSQQEIQELMNLVLYLLQVIENQVAISAELVASLQRQIDELAQRVENLENKLNNNSNNNNNNSTNDNNNNNNDNARYLLDFSVGYAWFNCDTQLIRIDTHEEWVEFVYSRPWATDEWNEWFGLFRETEANRFSQEFFNLRSLILFSATMGDNVESITRDGVISVVTNIHTCIAYCCPEFDPPPPYTLYISIPQDFRPLKLTLNHRQQTTICRGPVFYLSLTNGVIFNSGPYYMQRSGYFIEGESINIGVFGKSGARNFLGWFEDEELFSEWGLFYMPSRDVALKAKSVPQEGNHTITLINGVFGSWNHFSYRHLVSNGFTMIGSFGHGGSLALSLIPAAYIGERAVFSGWYIDGVRFNFGSASNPYFFAGGYPCSPLISPIPNRDIVIEARFRTGYECPNFSQGLNIYSAQDGTRLNLNINSRVEFLMPNGNWQEWATTDFVPLGISNDFTRVRLTPLQNRFVNGTLTTTMGVPVYLSVQRISTTQTVSISVGMIDTGSILGPEQGLLWGQMARVYLFSRWGHWEFFSNGISEAPFSWLNPAWLSNSEIIGVRIQPESFAFNPQTNTITVYTGQAKIFSPPFI